VECYAVVTDGSEWGWQAKYFWNLGTAQWRELDESIMTALGKHPRLARYIVYLPMDLPEVLLGGKRSEREKWVEHVSKWQETASSKGWHFDFILGGSSELIGFIAQSDWSGHRFFWFDTRYLNQPWFRSMLSEAIVSAGPLYKSELNVG
jgi:hypothetical protein